MKPTGEKLWARIYCGLDDRLRDSLYDKLYGLLYTHCDRLVRARHEEVLQKVRGI